jgi:DNA repair protein RadA/Sms
MASVRASGRTGKAGFRCSECGWTSTRWVGRCGQCQAWGTVADRALSVAGAAERAARPITEVDAVDGRATPSGIDELDRVLGGGLVPGGVVLLAGEPGVGKSTLALEVAARAPGTTLYATGEETVAQVRQRADRTGSVHDRLYLAAVRDLDEVLTHAEQVSPSLLVLDSIQTITASGVEGASGSPSQVRGVAAALVSLAKQVGTSVLLVGHVTKDGSVAGPRVLEHLVDVVVMFEGDRHSRLRLLRGIKNRFGASDEVGCLDLDESGIRSVPDPGRLFLSGNPQPVPGRCWTVTLEGRRALPVEVQALVGPDSAGNPRRVSTGLPANRVALLLAVLDRRTGMRLTGSDVYVATVGGLSVNEPAGDLAVALAIGSAAADVPLPAGVGAVGEVGLDGEVRPVGGIRHRVSELARVGARRVLVPATRSDGDETAPRVDGCEVVQVATLADAVRAAQRPLLAAAPTRHQGAVEGDHRA